MTQIITERLVLRHFTQADAPRVAALISDEDVHRWITRAPRPFGMPDAEWFINKHARPDSLVYATTLNDTVIGCCSITEEFGYWIGKPFWGKGYATEAGRALIAVHFKRSDTVLLSGYLEGNKGSANVLEKLGFSNAGLRIRRSEFFKRDVTIQSMTLSADDWRAP